MSFYSVYLQIRVVKQVSLLNHSFTIIQQLKFLGQILSTEKDGPANIYTLHEPSHGRTTPERQQKPFSEPCSGMDRPRRTFLRGQHRAHLPKTEPV